MSETQLFRPRRKLGDALYGEVLECELATTGERVAVKCVSLTRFGRVRRSVAPERAVDDPLQEKRVATLLTANGCHPNVVQQHFHFIRSRRLYLVAELCPDGDLHSMLMAQISAAKYLDEREVTRLMRQVLQGVYFLHGTLGIAHRDLSLENVLLCDDVCKVSDFGLTTDANKTCAGGLCGKDYYMAPEVVSGKPYDPKKADVWSLGIMWFMLLTGSPLVSIASTDDDSFGIFAEYGVAKVLEAWGHGDRIPGSTVKLLEKMLEVDPAQRVSVEEVLAHSAHTSERASMHAFKQAALGSCSPAH